MWDCCYWSSISSLVIKRAKYYTFYFTFGALGLGDTLLLQPTPTPCVSVCISCLYLCSLRVCVPETANWASSILIFSARKLHTLTSLGNRLRLQRERKAHSVVPHVDAKLSLTNVCVCVRARSATPQSQYVNTYMAFPRLPWCAVVFRLGLTLCVVISGQWETCFVLESQHTFCECMDCKLNLRLGYD